MASAVVDTPSTTLDNLSMDFNDVKQHFGSIAKAAEVLGVHRQAVYEWKARGVIPEGQQYKIEVLTGGALRADRGVVDSLEPAPKKAVAG